MEWIAPAQHVLVVGHARESLLRGLDARGSTITCVILTDTSPDEARVYCSVVYATGAGELSLGEMMPAASFDAIVLDRALDLIPDPSQLMADLQRSMRANSLLVAMGNTTSSRLLSPLSSAGYVTKQFERLGDSGDPSRFVLLAGASPAVTGPSELQEVLGLRQKLRTKGDALLTAHAALSTAKARIRVLERDALYHHAAERTLKGALEGEKLVTSALQRLIDSRMQALALARDEALQAEGAWYALEDEAASLRTRVAELGEALSASENKVREQCDRIDRVSAAEAAINKWSEDLQQEIFGLRSQIASQTESERQAREQLAREVELRERLTLELEESHAQGVEQTRQLVLETERRLGEEIRELRARVADSEQALTSQTDALIDSMRAEGSRLSIMIDTVQSSRFWRFKRWLNRLRGGASVS